MGALWNACFTAVAVMVGVPLLAAGLGLCARAILRRLPRRRRGEVVQLRLPLHENPPGKLDRLREGLGLH